MAWECFTGYPVSKLRENKIWNTLVIVLTSTLHPQPLLVTPVTTGCTALLAGTHPLQGYPWWQWPVCMHLGACHSKAPWHRREHGLEVTSGALITIPDQDVTPCHASPELPNSPAMWAISDQSLTNMDLQVVSRGAMAMRSTIHRTHKGL